MLACRVYGPYMGSLSMDCFLDDEDFPKNVEEYAPQNSTSGGQTVSSGVSYSLSGGVTAKPSGGPEAKLSANVQWSYSVSKFDADLSMKAAVYPNKVSWSYTGKDPDSHYRPFSSYHETAKSILTSTCTLQHAWVWTVKGSNSSSVVITPHIMIRDRWLTYRMATLECIPKYIETGHATYASITVPCPPRYHQTWSMNVESKDVDANKLKEIESFLASHLDKYFMPTCVFSTVKPEHKRATGIADSDEVAEFVSKCKQVFASTNGRELLREAGKRAGLSDKGSFTIVWRHTDLGVNSDREEFTFDMSGN